METSYHENYIRQLHHLLDAVKKSEKRFVEASDHVDSADYKDLFNRYVDERITIIAELKEAIIKLGGTLSSGEKAEIEKPQTTEEKINPDIKKEQSILERVRSSEREALEAYDEVLQGTILEDFNLKTLLMGHRLTINEAFTELDKRYFAHFKLSQPY
jgi:hypothetical protein